MEIVTLEMLEGVWLEPDFQSSLVLRCHALRKKPIAEFSVEDLRIMIGQKIGLRFLLPLALDILEKDPDAEGDCFPGDLRESVLACLSDIREQPDLLFRVEMQSR